MKRLHLFEIEDQPWCPAIVRDAMTDYLRRLFALVKPYAPAAPILAAAMREAGAHNAVDLCSGGGGPWLDLIDDVSVSDVLLSDRYPNREASDRAATQSGGRVRGYPEPVDATRLPGALHGFRTLFTSLHHFRPEQARAIIRDAVRAGEGIGIFEVTHRRLSSILLIGLVTIPTALLLSLTVRPLNWARLALHWLVPIVPLAVTFDGVVSCLRSYTQEELLEMAREVAPTGYTWKAGTTSGLTPMPVTWLTGVPDSR